MTDHDFRIETASDWDWEDRDPPGIWVPLFGVVLGTALVLALRVLLANHLPGDADRLIGWTLGLTAAVFLLVWWFLLRKGIGIFQLLAVVLMFGIATLTILRQGTEQFDLLRAQVPADVTRTIDGWMAGV